MDERERQHKLRERLSATSKKFLDSIDELHELEGQKRNAAISTPEFHELAGRITDKTREVFRLTTLQETLGDAIETGEVTINDENGDERHRDAVDDERETAGRETAHG